MTPTSTVGSVGDLKSLGAALLTSDWYTLPLFAVPVAFLIWSFNKWMSYNQDNADRNTRLQDELDKKAYKEIIVPLHGALSANLAETVSAQITAIPTGMSMHDFLQDYEKKKTELLKQTDYTALEGVIKFQDALEVFIKEKKSKFVLKACSRQNKKLMLAIAISSAVQIVDAVLTVFIKDSSYFSWGIGSWFVVLLLILILGGKYGLNENTIDNLGNA
jgi:hypothetical protein